MAAHQSVLAKPRLWYLVGAVILLLASAGVSIGLILSKAGGDGNGSDLRAGGVFRLCCTVDDQSCTNNAYCDSNATACSFCEGEWVSQGSLQVPSPGPNLRTPEPQGQDIFDNGNLVGGNSGDAVPSPVPTTPFPTHSEPGQTCAMALTKDGKAFTKPLQGEPGDLIFLERSGQLCTLWQVDDDSSKKVPVGRSYNGHQWEPYASDYGHLKFSCDPNTCSFILPPLPDGSFRYELATFDYELSETDEMARFLEKSSFGPSRESIAELREKGIPAFVKEQIEDVPLWSHRKFYRERVTAHSNRRSVTHPCERGARYRRYAIGVFERFKEASFQTDAKGRRVMLIDGEVRTILNATEIRLTRDETVVVQDGEVGSICGKNFGGMGGDISFGYGSKCQMVRMDGELYRNSPIVLDATTPPKNPTLSLDGTRVVQVADGELYVARGFDDPNCALYPMPRADSKEYIQVAYLKGEPWIFESQTKLLENTIDEPLEDGGGALSKYLELSDQEKEEVGGKRPELIHGMTCSNVPMNFLNEKSCKLSDEIDTCSLDDPSSKEIILDQQTLRKIYQASGRNVYVVEGLRHERMDYAPPCAAGSTSRWMRSNEGCGISAVSVSDATASVFANLLESSSDTNAYMKDIIFPLSGGLCSSQDTDKFGFKVSTSTGECWENVHRFEYQVFDFTDWVDVHPGGPNAITMFNETSFLKFPGWHEMDRWNGAVSHRTNVGRFGDTLTFSDLPLPLLSESVAEALDAVSALRRTGPTVVCGSSNEVASIPSLAGPEYQASFGYDSPNERKDIWMTSTLLAPDVIRQRVAWTMFQILCVSNSIGGANVLTEPWLSYYDIFVRNAFGSYRDVLKEVSFHILMTRMLTYAGNESTNYSFRRRKQVSHPDENYAREIMQLFSIGLYKLNSDGTQKLDENGRALLTYPDDEIEEYARVWTGFRSTGDRGNIETILSQNFIDPAVIDGTIRDRFPKLGLDHTYIGDGLPLCRDLPKKHFLLKGATYTLLGSNPRARRHEHINAWSDSDMVYMRLDPDHSALFDKLCNKFNGKGKCRHRSKTVLNENLSCFGEECSIDAPRVIDVDGVFYEYERLPCIHLAYFEGGKVIANVQKVFSSYACAHPETEEGSIGCCPPGEELLLQPTDRFTGERATFATAQQVCSDAGLVLCQDRRRCDMCTGLYWSESPCTQQAKISRQGKVGLTHHIPDVPNHKMHDTVGSDTKSFFSVIWSTSQSIDFVADYDQSCSRLGCARDPDDNLCLCSVEISESMAFSSAPSREAVLSELHIGAFDPAVSWGPHPVFDVSAGVRMHTMDGFYSTESVFEVVDDFGFVRFRKNLRSIVEIGNRGGPSISFRNPPHMNSLYNTDSLDPWYETEEALDQYFYHPNVGPFLAIRFAQRFGLSNPSPRYVHVASTAFRNGLYVDKESGISYGNGQYGNLGALVAALLLDREARSTILDADPTHGSLQEPLLRFIRVLKSLEFELKDDEPYLKLNRFLFLSIYQEPYELPNVFSFFHPEFQPDGLIGESGLVCPECEVHFGPSIIALMNALFALVKYGLDGKYDGFGWNCNECNKERTIGDFAQSSGFNQYSPSSGLSSREIVDELATLLTSGRLSQENRALLTNVYDAYKENPTEALLNVQQLILTSPEFHATALSRNMQAPRELPKIPKASKPHRTVLQIQVGGGWDSYNVLVPAECDVTNAAGVPVDQQYRDVRAELAVGLDETPLRISANNQPCASFAIHRDIPIFEQLYKENSLIFVANAGLVTTNQLTKLNWRKVTVSTLFAHNTMSEESFFVDPYRMDHGSGILGRMARVVADEGYTTAEISVGSTRSSTFGGPNPPLVISKQGPTLFNPRPDAEESFDLLDFSNQLNKEGDSYAGVFGDKWSSEYVTGTYLANFFYDIVSQTRVSDELENSSEDFDEKLKMITKLIKTQRERGVDRDFLMTGLGSWDHHNDLHQSLSENLQKLNSALVKLVDELKAQGKWDSTVIVITSEFGRNFRINSRNGSDHGWGGHYVVLGGGVKGGQILGKYLSDLTNQGPYMLQSKPIPTTPWESIWSGVAEWMGVPEDRMEEVLPNIRNSWGGDFTRPYRIHDMFNVS